jgi:tetratricopeptide (TPR) repeat protein
MRRFFLACLLLLAVAGASPGQNLQLHDRPRPYPAKAPPTRRELELRDSMSKYVDGLMYLHEDRFADALRCLEDAARLDPNAPAILKAQLPILIAFDRRGEALKTCQQVVALDPGDYNTWYVLAKLQKSMVRYADAIASLESGVKSAGLAEHPEAAQQMYLELGALCESNDKFGQAADAFNKAAAILEYPDVIAERAHVPIEAVKARASETYERIGMLYRKAKRYDDAVAALAKAKDRAPDRAGRLSYLLAQVSAEAGQPKQALFYLDAYVRTQPLGVEPYEMKVDLLRRLKQSDAIVPWLEDAAGRDRFNNGLHLILARELAAAKQAKKAEVVYTRIAEEAPSPEVYRGLFNVYKDQGAAGMTRVLKMLDDSVGKASRDDGPPSFGAVQRAKAMLGALRDDGDLARAAIDAAFRLSPLKNELKFDTLYFLAVMADKHRKTEEAERFYRQCLRDSKAKGNEAVLYSGLLRVLLKGQKNEAVIEICQEGLKNAQATNPLLFYNDLARAQASLKRYDEALRTVDAAIKQPNANELTFKMLRVRILMMAERFADAERDCKVLLKTFSKPGEVLEVRYLLSGVYSAAKQIGKAEAELQAILKIDPDNPTVNNDLGYLWADQGKNLAVAEDMIRKALDVDRSQRRRNPNLSADDDKDNAAYVDSLGWVLFRRGQIEAARKELERAIALNEGDDPTIYDHLGDVYSRLQMHPEATRVWQRALDLYHQGVRGNDPERVRDLERKLQQIKQAGGVR